MFEIFLDTTVYWFLDSFTEKTKWYHKGKHKTISVVWGFINYRNLLYQGIPINIENTHRYTINQIQKYVGLRDM